MIPAADHIGIISPYNAQVGKIRNVISKIAKDIKVGSVEEFQGQVCSSNYPTIIIDYLLIWPYIIGTTRYHHLDSPQLYGLHSI